MSLVTLHWPKYLVLVISPVEKSKVVSEILTTLVMWDMARETHCFLAASRVLWQDRHDLGVCVGGKGVKGG